MNKLLEQAREWKLQNSKSVSQRHVYLYAKILMLNSQKYPCCFLSHSVVRSPFLSVKLFFEAEMQDGPPPRILVILGRTDEMGFAPPEWLLSQEMPPPPSVPFDNQDNHQE